MKRYGMFSGLLFFVFFSCLPVSYASYDAEGLLSLGLSYQIEGSLKLDAPDYQWWYGCSPTSAGMLMAYYDEKGYGGLKYSNLIPGAVAEKSTYTSSPGTWSYAAQSAIASSGHVAAFYSGGYQASGDDKSRSSNLFNCLADFMGTSQDNLTSNGSGNKNGFTTYFYKTDGSRLYADTIYGYGSNYYNLDGMFGIYEYFHYCDYGSSDLTTVTSIFTQTISGFSFINYKAEIDAGRVVIIHLNDHDVLGYGYGDNNTVFFNDTWTDGEHSMAWGGSYSGMSMWGVTAFTPTGGSAVPIPAAIWLLGSGLLGLIGIRRRMKS